MSFSDWNLVCLPNTALLRAIAYSACVKQKMGIRSEEMPKSILTYLVPKPFDQIKPLSDSKEATEVGNRSTSHNVIKGPGEFPRPPTYHCQLRISRNCPPRVQRALQPHLFH
jgi:hypothetical protein